MPSVSDIAAFLDQFAPLHLAEQWDNVGLLVGSGDNDVARVMTCLTITPATAAEAVRSKANLVVSHHPLPFQPLRTITSATITGQLLLDLIAGGVAVYSPHTSFDSAQRGINRQLAEGIGLQSIAPLVPAPTTPELGAGRWGKVPGEATLSEVVEITTQFLGVTGLHVVGAMNSKIRAVAVSCGSGGQLLSAAAEHGCECLLTGEARFHTCLEAEALGLTLILAGHYATERFGVEALADVLSGEYADIKVWASRDERDPLRWTNGRAA